MDSKLQEVLLDYGLEGYGLYWYCLELIVNKIDVDNLTFELEHDARIIARNTGSTPQKVSEMMKRFVDLGLFQNNEGRITCLKLLTRLDKSMTSNPKFREAIELAKNSHDSVMMIPDSVMQDKKRLEEIREEEITPKKATPKITISDIEQVQEGYNAVIDNFRPNWQKLQSISDVRKKTIKTALKLAEPRAKALDEKPVSYLIRLLEAMSQDDYFSGNISNKNPQGFNCSFETNFRQSRICQAIDKFAGEPV